MAAKRLVRYGRDLALVIDARILEALGIGESTPLDVRVREGKIVISPLDDSEERESFREMLKKFNDKYANALRRLAD